MTGINAALSMLERIQMETLSSEGKYLFRLPRVNVLEKRTSLGS